VSNSVSHIKEEHKLKVFKNIVFRKAFGTKMKYQKDGENCIMRSFTI